VNLVLIAREMTLVVDNKVIIICTSEPTLAKAPIVAFSAVDLAAVRSSSICSLPSSFLGLAKRVKVRPASWQTPSSCLRMSTFLLPAMACTPDLVNIKIVSANYQKASGDQKQDDEKLCTKGLLEGF
jgi:hypothetical protein